MRFKPNYRIERAERDRAKKARKDEKLKRQQDRATQRIDDGGQAPAAGPEIPRTKGSDTPVLRQHLQRAHQGPCLSTRASVRRSRW